MNPIAVSDSAWTAEHTLNLEGLCVQLRVTTSPQALRALLGYQSVQCADCELADQVQAAIHQTLPTIHALRRELLENLSGQASQFLHDHLVARQVSHTADEEKARDTNWAVMSHMHHNNLEDLKLLRGALHHGDPQDELLARVNRLIQNTEAVIRNAGVPL